MRRGFFAIGMPSLAAVLLSCVVAQPLTDATIHNAVDNLAADGTHPTYGHISGWDVSQVTDMSWLFEWESTFNQPLDGWDVSRVTNMGSMFSGGAAFNQLRESWTSPS